MNTGAKDDVAPLWAALEEAGAALGDGGSAGPERVAAVLEAAGRLIAAGAPEDEVRARASAPLDEALVTAALDREPIAEALESEAIALLDDLEYDESDCGEGGRAGAILDHLAVRDRAEMEVIGAALVTGRSIDSIEAGAAGRLGFDLAVRPRAFELVAHNVDRAERSSWIHPRRRARFWWWFEGLSLDPRGVSAMSAVAALVARSAEARERFERLVRAEEGWAEVARAERSAPARSGARVVKLRDWLERRAAGGRAGIALAAAPLDEALVLETDDAHVSWAAPGTLIVDLLSDRRPGSAPALVVPGSEPVALARVEGAEERFAIALDPAVLGRERVVLRLPLSGGDVDVELPPADAG